MKPKTKKQKQMDADNVTAAIDELAKAAGKVHEELSDMHDCWMSTYSKLDDAITGLRSARQRANETHTYSCERGVDYKTATWIGAYDDTN